MAVNPANAKNMSAHPYLPTVSRKVAAMAVEQRNPSPAQCSCRSIGLGVGISSEIATHPHTPGPMAKNAMKEKMAMVVSHINACVQPTHYRPFKIQKILCWRPNGDSDPGCSQRENRQAG